MKRYLIPLMLLGVILAQFIPAAGFTVKPAAAATTCDWAQFIADVTVPDGTSFAPGAAFTKTWRLKNIGTCTWSTSYALVFASGEKMGATTVVNLPSSVAPGATVDLTVNMTAPATTGKYRGYWQLRNASNVLFGIGTYANKPFWVEINVSQSTTTGYDFVANYCSATWSSGAGSLACPGTDGDVKGFVIKQDAPKLENGTTDTNPGLLMVPQKVTGGYIQAVYPPFTVQKGDRFQTIVNCAYGASSCYVNFRLNYRIGTGAVKTLWTFKERYEGLFYRLNLSLDSLAGQNVTFILYIADVSGYGSPAGDRALWGAPKIVRLGGGTPPPSPTPTATGGPSPTPVATTCNRAAYVADVTIADGTAFTANTPFTKTWRIKNVGTCTWTTAYNAFFVSGNSMGAPASVNLTSNVAPGQTVDISVPMTAPNVAGTYQGYWKLRNASGTAFGVGSTYNNPFWVLIKVTTTTGGGTTTTIGTAYDFTANACSATWASGAGALPCPGTDNDARGFVLKPTAPKLENNTTGQPGLLTAPQNVTDGFIQGIYPAFMVQSGDKFQAIINCEYGATACFVTFRLDYQIDANPIQTFWAFYEKYDNQFYRANIDLTPLAGKNVKFILTVLAYGSPSGDRALWVAPIIARSITSSSTATATNTAVPTTAATQVPSPTATATSVPTTAATVQPSPTATATLQFSNWLTYVNNKYAFQFKYPPTGQIVNPTDTSATITLPFTAGTNLVEKYVTISVVENAPTCSSPLAGGGAVNTTQQVTINSIQFLKETGSGSGAGQIYKWTGYSTLKGTTCISVGFVLHSANPGNYQVPPPLYDEAVESAVFGDIMSTFGWKSP
jgi:Ig-like domain from next to BRCA1 gene